MLTAMLNSPAALTAPVTLLSLMLAVTTSPTVNGPVTLPVRVLVGWPPSAAEMMLSPATGLKITAALMGGFTPVA